MITPEQPAAQSGALCVPTAALEIDGTAPAVGDEVEMTVKARVARAEGEHTYLDPIEINGQPAPAPGAKPGEPDADDVMRLAEKADAMR